MIGTPTQPVALQRITSPIGRIEVVGDGAAIISLAIERGGKLTHDAHEERPDAVTARAVLQLEEYFAGHRRHFDVPVVLERGTPFQRAVWHQLVALDWGEVASYGALGAAAGSPGAGRAVGGAVGANPVPIIVPCHRVLGAAGVITGYSAGEGIPTKAWLLQHEGIAHRVPVRRHPEPGVAAEAPGPASAA